jgi:phospholipid/cholesterol/gamma-HCH transport system substrate-binding protein
MLTRFVRIQLVIFSVLSAIGVVVLAFSYLQVPTLLGLGRMTVTIELPNGGGLYRFGNVTYRGVQVGKVTNVAIARQPSTHTEATLSLTSSARIPTDLVAEVRSVSAIGELYVDLVPRTDTGPYLHDGSVIAMRDTNIPHQIGPVLDQVSSLLGSIPKDRLNALVGESYQGLNNAGFDFGSLIDSSATLAHDVNGVADRAQSLIDNSGPLLDSQAATTEDIRTWARSLAGVTDQLVQNDPQIHTLLQQGPAAADQVSGLLAQIKPTLPVLLANLSTIGQVGVTYNASLQQVLILLPPFVSAIQAELGRNNATGISTGGEFSMTAGDPNPCTVGFLPPSAWRNPADTTEADTPDGLYCKLPADSPISVRGARNYPCMGHPGKRAPTVQLCDDPRGFVPTAVREHVLGAHPFDPNLVAQGIPPDDRAETGDNIFAPTEGTPGPGAAPPASPPAPPAPLNPLPPPPIPPDMPDPTPAAAPSAFDSSAESPRVAVAQYNPRTGTYLAGDGQMYTQSDLVRSTSPKSWTDLLPR